MNETARVNRLVCAYVQSFEDYWEESNEVYFRQI